MKRLAGLMFAAAGIAVFSGCSSTPTAEQAPAGVEDRTPTTGQSGPAVKPSAAGGGTGTTSRPIEQPVARGMEAHRDPNSILSKERSIFYGYDSDAIDDKYRPMMQAHARYLQGNGNMKMLIQGNTDDRGSREYNLALGQRRAEAARRMMVLMGAKEAQIESVSLGEEKPRCEERTDPCYAQNRRSDILYGGEF